MKKSLLKLSLIAAIAVSGLEAKESEAIKGLDVSANMALVSNYIWRGATQTTHSAAFQSGIDAAHSSGLYVGTWGSSLSAGTEWDLYAGFATEVAGLSIDVGYINYANPQGDKTTADNYAIKYDDFAEVYGAFGYGVAGIDLGLKVSNEIIATTDTAMTIEVSVGKDLEVVALGATYGTNTEDAFIQVDVSKPCKVTGGEWLLTYGMTMPKVGDSATAYGFGHAFSF